MKWIIQIRSRKLAQDQLSRLGQIANSISKHLSPRPLRFAKPFSKPIDWQLPSGHYDQGFASYGMCFGLSRFGLTNERKPMDNGSGVRRPSVVIRRLSSPLSTPDRALCCAVCALRKNVPTFQRSNVCTERIQPSSSDLRPDIGSSPNPGRDLSLGSCSHCPPPRISLYLHC
jgi:hypothetical protein